MICAVVTPALDSDRTRPDRITLLGNGMSESSRKAPATSGTRAREATTPSSDQPRSFGHGEASLSTAAVSEPGDPRTQRASQAAAALTGEHAALRRAVKQLAGQASAPSSLVATVLASLNACEARAAELCSLQREARIVLENEVQERTQAGKLARGQTETLVRALAVCAEEPELDKFLGHVLRAIAEQLAAQGASLWIRDPATDRPVLRLCCEHGVISCDADSNHSAALKPPCLRDDPTWQEIVRTRQPVVHEDVATDSRIEPLRGYLLDKGVRALLEVPLLLGEEMIGFISIRSRTPGRFRPELVALAQALAHQATLAMQLTRLADAARDTAVLAERNRIAQEIHDGLAQSFTGILMQVEAAEESGAFAHRLPVEVFASKVRGLARDGLTEARRSAMALRPQHGRRGGLDTALRELALRSTAPGHTVCTFRRFGAESLPPDQEHALFRIAQEAVSNALRHGQPDHVFISLHETSCYWELYVLDDGVGIQQSLAIDAQQGFGLESMRERARTIGADWHIGSRIDEGTSVTVRVPKLKST